MLTLLVVLNGLTLLVLIWILNRIPNPRADIYDMSVPVSQITSEIRDVKAGEALTVARLDEIKAVLKQIEKGSFKAYQLREALSEELGDVLKLANMQGKHLDRILENVVASYWHGDAKETYRAMLAEHPYHESEEVREWVSNLECEHYCRAFAKNVRRLLDTDMRVDVSTEKRGDVEEALETLEKAIASMTSLEWKISEVKTPYGWMEWHDGLPEEIMEQARKKLEFNLNVWMEASFEESYLWKSPINGETMDQFEQTVRDDADELRIKDAGFQNPNSGSDF